MVGGWRVRSRGVAGGTRVVAVDRREKGWKGKELTNAEG